MELNYTITRAQLSKISNHIGKGAAKRAKLKKHAFLAIATSVLMWAPVGYLWAKHKSEYGPNASLLFVTALVVVYLASVVNRAMSQHKSKYIPRNNGPSLGLYTMKLLDSSLLFIKGGLKTEVDFKEIFHYDEDNEFMYLYIDNNQAFFIPKEAFPEEGKNIVLNEIKKTHASAAKVARK